jgi:hypothetical protein
LAANNLLDAYEKLFPKSKCKDIVKKIDASIIDKQHFLNVQKGKLK